MSCVTGVFGSACAVSLVMLTAIPCVRAHVSTSLLGYVVQHMPRDVSWALYSLMPSKCLSGGRFDTAVS